MARGKLVIRWGLLVCTPPASARTGVCRIRPRRLARPSILQSAAQAKELPQHSRRTEWSDVGPVCLRMVERGAANSLANNFSLPITMSFTGGIGWQIDNKSSINVTFVHDHKRFARSERTMSTYRQTGVIKLPNALTTLPVRYRSCGTIRFHGSVPSAPCSNDGSSRYDALGSAVPNASPRASKRS